MQLSDRSGQVGTRPAPNPVIAPGWINNDLTQSTPPTYSDPDMMNGVLAELINLLTQVGLSASKTDVTQVMQAILAMARMTAGGTANALTVTPPVALPVAASIRDGTTLRIVPSATNTAAATLAVSGGAASSITYPDGSALEGGIIINGWPIEVMKMGGGSPVWWLLTRTRVKPNRQKFTSSTTWTVPNGVSLVHVRLWGAGGGAGGASSNGDAAAGGGAGEFREGFVAVTSGGSVAVTIAAGGGGGFNTGTNGNDAGDTSFGSLVAKGGLHGQGSNGAGIVGGFGAGGSAGGGTGDSQAGDAGGIAFFIPSVGLIAAPGGAPYYGSTHQGLVGSGGTFTPGAGFYPGTGGTGGINAGGGAASGGAGAPGLCVIEWWA